MMHRRSHSPTDLPQCFGCGRTMVLQRVVKAFQGSVDTYVFACRGCGLTVSEDASKRSNEAGQNDF